MDTQDSPLGKFGVLAIPLAIVLAIAVKSFWLPVLIAAGAGWLIANVRTVLMVGKMRSAMTHNPLLGLQAKVQGVDASMQIRFIFIQSMIGAVVFAAWTAVACGIAFLIR